MPAREPSHSRGRPLLVALHGCTQTAGDFALGTGFDAAAARHDAIVLYPEQSVRSNPQRCWNWFLPRHQTRERGEPAAILRLVEDICAQYAVDRARVYVAGLSAGGSMAAILAEQAPEVFAAAGIMAGVALHASHDHASALRAMQGDALEPAVTSARAHGSGSRYARLRASIWTGSDDDRVAPCNAEALARQFLSLTGVESALPKRETTAETEIVRWYDRTGRLRVERWIVSGMGHAWSGGTFRGSYTYPPGPPAAEALFAFFENGAPVAEHDAGVVLCGGAD